MSLRTICQVIAKRAGTTAISNVGRTASVSHSCQRCLSDIVDPPDFTPPIPLYVERGASENDETKRARLLYQSRKRGMTENCLLLSTFAALHLDKMTKEELILYDRLINIPSNDWEIYYWMIGNKPTPEEYDNKVMDMLKKHAQNDDRAVRLQQPDLY